MYGKAEQYNDTSIQLHVGGWYLRWNTTSQELYGFNQGGAKNTYHVAVYRAEVTPLPPIFLPEYVITITHTVDSEGNVTVTCDRTFADILSALQSGMLLKVVVKLEAPSLNKSGKIVTRHIEYVNDAESEQFFVYIFFVDISYLITAEGISTG